MEETVLVENYYSAAMRRYLNQPLGGSPAAWIQALRITPMTFKSLVQIVTLF